MSAEEDKSMPDVVTGTILVNSLQARELYDSVSSVFFVSYEFRKNLSTPTNKLPFPLDVEIADSKVMVISNVYRDVEIKIDDSTFRINLIPIMLGEFNIVIDIDWLDKYNVVILYTSFEKKSVNDVLVVNEFLDVFRKICQKVSHTGMLERSGSRELANIDVVLETTENIETIRERLKATQDRWENYADNRRKHIKFNVRDFILKRVGEVAYIELPEEMRGIHNTFHVSYLKKWLADESSVITLDDIEIYLELTSREEPKTILGRKLRQLQNKVIPLVKVQMEAS
nr:reverse transcriptase domain-containing protein [Tanacetum cinerariifolium]